jgi:hypothetical protein
MDGLRAAQQRLEYGPLIETLARAIVAAVATAEAAHSSLAILLADWQQRRKWRKNSAAVRALPLLLSRPVVTRKLLASMLKVTEPAAGQAVSQLTELGILTERTGWRRNRVFAAWDVLRIFNRSSDAN